MVHSISCLLTKDNANLFAGKFTLNDMLHSLPDFSSRTGNLLYEDHLGMVANAICEPDVAKATGPDCISSVVLKMSPSKVSPVLAKLYNKFLFESYFPSSWKFPCCRCTKMTEKDLISLLPISFQPRVKYLNHL